MDKNRKSIENMVWRHYSFEMIKKGESNFFKNQKIKEMKKKLGQLKINAERVIDNDELINIKGGSNQQCYCAAMGWFSVICGDKDSVSIACAGSPYTYCYPC